MSSLFVASLTALATGCGDEPLNGQPDPSGGGGALPGRAALFPPREAIAATPRVCNTVDDRAPRAPQLLAPVDGERDVDPAALRFIASPFADPDAGDQHRASLWEIFDDGGDRVWSLHTSDVGQLTSARLSDGVFEGAAAEDQELKPFGDYTVRVSFEDDSGGCDDWSAASLAHRFRVDDGSSFLFDDEQVLTFSIDIPQSTIDAINAEAGPPGCVQFDRAAYPGSLRFGGLVFDDAGISNKGGCGSSRNLNGKASMKVRLSWDADATDDVCPQTRRLFGQKTLTFNNDVQDQTSIHERLGYALYRAAGVPAPRAVSANLVVNGQLWGLYTLVETPDRRFLSRFFDDNDGMMYEGAYWCDLLPENVPNGEDDDDACFEREFSTDACSSSHEDATDWELLRQFTQQIRDQTQQPSFYPEVKSFLDFDEFISMWAVDATISHWDAYSFHIINNYRVYHDPEDGLWRVMPWGIDQTFNGGGDVDPFSSDTVLVNACLNDPECVAAFGQRLREVATLFEQLRLGDEAQRIHDQIQPFIYEDPRKEFGNGAWENNVDALKTWIGARPARVRQYLDARGL